MVNVGGWVARYVWNSILDTEGMMIAGTFFFFLDSMVSSGCLLHRG